MMPRIQHASWMALAVVFAATAAPAGEPPDRPRVTTDRGPVLGIARNDGVQVFMGIPYAEAERWRPPHETSSWVEPLDASRPGPACPQDTRRSDGTAGAGMDEQCLYANVYTGRTEDGRKRPVMAWIHGGSFRWGTGSDPKHDGKRFVDAGLMLVTFNYRLGRLGRFAHPALSQAQAGEPLGNYSLMDQLAALQWVRRNAEAFGGDPDRVTIFGCSAGGVSVTTLMVTPASAGLFHGAIAQSGGIVEVGGQRLAGNLPGPPSLEADGLRMAAKLGIDSDAVAKLRALPVQDIVAYDGSEFGYSMNPVVDGRILPDDIGVLFEQGRQHAVPFMVGSADWEDSLLGRASIPSSVILAPVKADIEAFRASYDGADDDALARGWFRDGVFIAPSRLLADRMRKVGQPGFVYLFTYVPEQARGQVPGAAHCSETPLVFGNAVQRNLDGSSYVYGEQDQYLSRMIGDAWIGFALAGTPQAPGLPDWPAFRFDTSDRMMELGAEPRLVERYRPSVMDYYRRRTESLLQRVSD
jgi:para-nitrobenzyl esterase